MFQFTIKKTLWVTLYFAFAFAIANLSGFDFLMTMHVFVIHFVLIFSLPVAVWEYRGYQKRFAIAALATELYYCFFIFERAFRNDFVTTSLIAFATAYIAGTTSAAAYRAIVTPEDPCHSWRPLDLATQGLRRLLPPRRMIQRPDELANNGLAEWDENEPLLGSQRVQTERVQTERGRPATRG